MRVGFVGLGVMGGPMAGHLVAAGQDVVVWNRTPQKSKPLQTMGATVATTLAEVGESCEVIFTCVCGSQDVKECVSEMARAAKPGTLFVDHSTIEPTAAREIYSRLKGQGLSFIDAPITGGSVGAQKGQLTIFAGAEQEDYDRVVPIMAPYTRRIERVGGPGQGQTMKLANQIAVAGALLALCESLAFAERAGLDISLTRDMLSGGAAGSWAFDNYGPKILTKDWSPGFSVRNQQKDLLYCLETAKSIGMELPGTDLVHQLLAKLQEQGRNEEATAALFDILVQS
jgi:3-hydroxyisobutyrate dehydrogenase-like beta-hydroxyacid dehydrogenase